MSKSYVSSKVEIRESPISGKGIFAKQLIKKDEIWGIKGGDIVDLNNLQKLNSILAHAFLQIEDNYFIGPTCDKDYADSMMNINHSCDPNTGFEGNVVCVAMKDILPGEEITIDYATFISVPYLSFSCNCNKSNCRKAIKNTDWQKPELQDKYGTYFQTYLIKKFSK